MSKEGLKDLLGVFQVVEIIRKLGLSSKTDIKNMLKMARRNDISADVVSMIPITEDGRNKS